jgi:hypothetical protein
VAAVGSNVGFIAVSACRVSPLLRGVSCATGSIKAGEMIGLAGEQAVNSWIAKRETNKIRIGLLIKLSIHYLSY